MRLKLFLSFLLVIVVAVAGVALIVQLGTAREVRSFMFGGGMGIITEMQTALEDYYAANGTWQGVGERAEHHPNAWDGSRARRDDEPEIQGGGYTGRGGCRFGGDGGGHDTDEQRAGGSHGTASGR